MKKIFLIIASIVLFLITNPILAQTDPGDDPDAAAMPIDDYVVVLAVIGLIYVFLKLRAFAQRENELKD
jgi:hypothetical protein